MTGKDILLGQTLQFTGDPFVAAPEDQVRVERHGAALIEDGRVIAVGPADALLTQHPDARPHNYGDAVIMAGFIDAHAHYPQTGMIASWGKRLIDWLNSYTFPEELKFSDSVYAAHVAGSYLDLLIANGTTSVASFCTSHPESVTAFFEAAMARRMRVVGGKTCMDRNAPEGLLDTPQRAYDESKALLEHWHDRGRVTYAITPRFSPTSSPEQLEALGALWSEHPECPMQTHLSEQPDEVAWVRALYPDARDYLDSYERFGLLGPGAIYGHAIHLEPREIARIREVDAALAHCPTSNTFIGSGIFAATDHCFAKVRVGLATDTGGGSSFSMLRTMAAAYELSQLRGSVLHPAQLLWLATMGSARALRLDDRIGNLSPGHDADIIVLDSASTPGIAQRSIRAETFWEQIFPTIMMGDDRAIRAVWLCGTPVTR